MTLEVPNKPTECDDRTKKDFETLMADPVSGDIYLAEKNEFENDVTLYKVYISFDATYPGLLMKALILYLTMYHLSTSEYWKF